MKFLKEAFREKDKKSLYTLSFTLAAAVLVLILAGTVFNGTPKSRGEPIVPPAEILRINGEQEYAESLEHKLEEILSSVAGAGEVKVMVTLRMSAERVLARETNTSLSTISENDGAGGTRESKTHTENESVVRGRSADEPFVLSERSPVVEGVIIIAKGGDDIHVKDALTRAAFTVLGIDAHRVQVLKMK